MQRTPTRRAGRLLALGLLLAAGGAGCETKLVTGYEPRRLGDSPAERRAYYAGRFTAAAREAEQERALDARSRRPAVGPSQY